MVAYECVYGAEPKSKTIKETVWDWELLNDVKPVWLRSPRDVPDEDYVKFYQSLTKVRPPTVCCSSLSSLTLSLFS